ncbi:MAG TPA: dienelactone hydrolase family protein [Gemmatimonadaceae bacterium]|nr:dienelactone hydrolase family protein [Gemmatimonadaceae bacterium]
MGTARDGAYVAHPRGKGRHPAVIVIHANRNTEPYIASTTEMLGEAGFVAMAVDVFHFLPNNATWESARRTPGDSVTAVVRREFREPRLVRNVQAAIDYLRRQQDVDPGGVALLGFCGGGWNALLLATQLRDVGAVVAFYAPTTLSDVQHRSPMEVVSYIRVPVLYQRATTDPSVPLTDVERFEAALRAQGTSIERIDCAAAHGFFAWNRDGVFNESEATRAWRETVHFLRDNAGRPMQPRALAPSRTSLSVPSSGTDARASMHVLHAGE